MKTTKTFLRTFLTGLIAFVLIVFPVAATAACPNVEAMAIIASDHSAASSAAADCHGKKLEQSQKEQAPIQYNHICDCTAITSGHASLLPIPTLSYTQTAIQTDRIFAQDRRPAISFVSPIDRPPKRIS